MLDQAFFSILLEVALIYDMMMLPLGLMDN